VRTERELTQCQTNHHQSALSLHRKHQCHLVTEVVKLQLPTEGNIIQVTPSHVSVKRCRGSCPANTPVSCKHKEFTLRAVPVMMVVGGFRTGYLETVCQNLEVREDVSCECGCEVRREDCSTDLHLYDNNTCSCPCRARSDCTARQEWDLQHCRCFCREDTWQPCSTGYLFDSQESCQCIAVHYISGHTMAGLTVLCVALVISTNFSVFLYYRKTKERRQRRESLARVLDNDDTDEEDIS